MRSLFRESEHLFRVALLYVLGTIALLALRAWTTPADFGTYGHFRAGAITDNMQRAPTYAGQDACVECHVEQVEARAEGGHRAVRCEACHGPLAGHAADPIAEPTPTPRAQTLCMSCHFSSKAKPVDYPQVDAVEHSMGAECHDCHDPHLPGI